MTIDHEAALEIAEDLTNGRRYIVPNDISLVLARAYLDLYEQSGLWDEQHARQHTLVLRQQAELVLLKAVAEAAAGVKASLTKEPLLHGDDGHRLWLLMEINERLQPLQNAITAWRSQTGGKS